MSVNIPPRADTPISSPVLMNEDYQLVDMNGFSWTNKNGLVITNNSRNQDPLQFFGNQP